MWQISWNLYWLCYNLPSFWTTACQLINIFPKCLSVQEYNRPNCEETWTGETHKLTISAQVCIQSPSWVDGLRTAGLRPGLGNDTSSGNSSWETSASPYLYPVGMTRWSFTGLLYTKLPPDVLSQISVVEMFTLSKLGLEPCLHVLDQLESSWTQHQCATIPLISICRTSANTPIRTITATGCLFLSTRFTSLK